jgi:hypothetical protein
MSKGNGGDKPLVNSAPHDAKAVVGAKRLGFLEGQFDVPDDFDRMHRDEIVRLFEGE